MAEIEYRAIIWRDGREQVAHYRFPKKDIEWGGYFHNYQAHEVIRWEERTIGDWKPSP